MALGTNVVSYGTVYTCCTGKTNDAYVVLITVASYDLHSPQPTGYDFRKATFVFCPRLATSSASPGTERTKFRRHLSFFINSIGVPTNTYISFSFRSIDCLELLQQVSSALSMSIGRMVSARGREVLLPGKLSMVSN